MKIKKEKKKKTFGKQTQKNLKKLLPTKITNAK